MIANLHWKFENCISRMLGLLVCTAAFLAAAQGPACAAAPDTPPIATIATNALQFNGEQAQGITITGTELAPSPFNVSTALTIEAWINVASWTARYQAIVTKGDAWGLVRADNTSKISFRTALSGQSGVFDDLVSAADLPLGTWQHVAAVFTGSKKQIFINGVLSAEKDFAGPLAATPLAVVFGGNADDTNRTLQGTIDSVRLWSIQRSPAEIAALKGEYLRGSEPGLLGDWRFNESTGTQALDKSPGGYDGTLVAGKIVGGTPPTRVAGLLLNPPADGDLALFFNNPSVVPSPQYANVTPVPATAFDFTDALTAEAWIYPAALPISGSAALLSKGAGAWEVRYNNTGKISFFTSGVAATVPGGDPMELIGNTRVEPGVWTHVAVVWNRAANTKLIYLNGVLDASVPTDGVLGATPLRTNTLPVLFGAEPLSETTAQRPYYGTLEEVRLWRVVRNPSELQANYLLRLNGTEPGLAGSWSFREADGLTTVDRSPSGLVATLSTGMSSLNRVGGLLLGEPLLASYTISLNGTDQAAAVENSAANDLAFGGFTSLTIETWIKPTQTPDASFMDIVMKGASGYGLALDSDMHLRFLVDAEQSHALASTGVVPLNIWSHVAVVVDGAARTTTFYINGKPAGSVNSAVITSSPGSLAFGRHGGATLSNFFRGGLDEVRIWNTARTPTEIGLFAFGELPASSTQGIVGHWSFTEGSGTTVADTVAGRAAILLNTTNAAWQTGPVFPEAPSLPPGLNLAVNPKAAGLWIGQVTLTKVNEVQRAVNGSAAAVTPAGSSASLRILLHVDATGRVRLLKDVIIMQTQPTGTPAPPPQPVLVTDPSKIPTYQGVVRRGGKLVGLRYGTAAFDFDGFDTTMVGGIGAGIACAGRIALSQDAPTNPYRHKFHPDHQHGFDIIRVFSLQFDGVNGDPLAAAPSYGVNRISGTYRESIAGLHKITLKTEGTVTLDRISTVSTLNIP